MGTRGAIVLVADGQEKVIYNHFDSYPQGLGEDVLGWLSNVLRAGDGDEGMLTESAARELVVALKPAPNREPTAEDLERYAEWHDPGVSTGKDWYALLRKTQGDPDAMLRAGLYEDDAADFPLDSLFCEWAYGVDFDERAFEVYKGFQETPPTAGRWVGRRLAPRPRVKSYYPVQRIAVWSFDKLPAPVGEWWMEQEWARLRSEAERG